jgi:hypothetical protein
MQAAGDLDWLKLDLTKGKTYTIKTTGLDASAQYDIVPAAGALDYPVQVDAGKQPSMDGTVTFTADSTGVYEFSASDPSGLTGAYTVSVATVTDSYTLAAGKTLAVGGTDKATLQSAGDTDWFKINLVAGKTYTFKTTGLDEFAEYDIVAASKAADGALPYQATTAPAANGTVTFTADATGAYEFEAFDPSGKTGAYTVSDAVVTDTYTLAAGKTLAVGGTDAATMQAKGDTDWFKIDLVAGTTYTFTATGLDEGAQLSVLPAAEAGDRQVTVNGTTLPLATQELTFTADTTGAYEVSIYDFSGKTGAYTVKDAVVTNSYTLAKHVALAVGATDKPTMQTAGDTDWFKINLVAGKTYTFKTTGLDLFADFDILPAAEAQSLPVPVEAFSLSASKGLYTYTAATTGAYEVSIDDFSGKTGAYTISDAMVTNTYALADDVALAVGGTDNATMQSAGDTDWFKINLVAGKTYTFKIKGLDNYAQYSLYPASEALNIPVEADSAKGPAASGELTFTAGATGAYELGVSDWSGLTGAYTVSDALVTNTYTLAAGVSLAAPAATPAVSAATTRFVQAMASFAADAAAHVEGLATSAASASGALLAGGHGIASHRIGASWA